MNKNVNGYNHSVGNRETTSETLLGNNYEHCSCCKKWFVVLLLYPISPTSCPHQQNNPSIKKAKYFRVHKVLSNFDKINTFNHPSVPSVQRIFFYV